MNAQRQRVLHLAGLGLVSAGALAFQIGLTRLFAVQQFHHFAFLVVSLAVLGTSASGAVLALRRRPTEVSLPAAGTALAMGAAYLTLYRLALDPYTLIWDRSQALTLVAALLAAAAPFVLAGWTTAAALVAAGTQAYRPYAASLLGSGAGAVIALWSHASGGVTACMGAAVGLAALGGVMLARRGRLRLSLGLLALTAAGAGALQPPQLDARLSPYKPLEYALHAPGAERVGSGWDASSRLDVVANPAVHLFPGLSINALAALPAQVAAYLDGEGPFPLTDLDPGDVAARALAGRMPAGVAYALRPGAEALILRPGGGLEAQLALAAGARRVNLALDEPLLRRALAEGLGGVGTRWSEGARVRWLDRTTPAAVRARPEAYDIVHLALSDPYRPVTAGAYSLHESYDLTSETLAAAYRSLTPEGLLLATRWLSTPPAEEARLFATLVEVIEQDGGEPAAQLVAFRGMRTATLIAARRAWTPAELEQVRDFLEVNAYDPIHLPDLAPEELNRHNRLPRDVYHELFAGLLDDRPVLLRTYAYDVRPVSDARPYFFHFFRWSQIPEIVNTLGTTWQPFGGSGYLVLIILLGVMAGLAVPLALTPLIVLGRRGLRRPPPWPTLVYFAGLGAGYLLVEIAFLQRLTLLLDRPALALATVLFALLGASGLGSLASPRLPLRPVLAAIVVGLGATHAFLPLAIESALGWGLVPRLAVAAASAAPLGLLMGVPFAAGLRRLEGATPGWAAWAWSINGAVSGVSGVLAAMLLLEWGFGAAFGAAGLAYLAAWGAAARLGGPLDPAVVG